MINTVRDTDPYEVQTIERGEVTGRHGFTSLNDAQTYAETLRRANRQVPEYSVEIVTR